MSLAQAVGRGFRLLYQPRAEFLAALQESDGTSDIALRFLAPWLAATAAFYAVQTSFRAGFINFVLDLAFTFIAAWALMLFSRALSSPIDFRSAFRINAYTAPAAFATTVLCVVLAKLSALIALAGFVYGIYVMYIGCKVTMPRGGAVATRATAGTLCVGFVASLVLVMFMGGSPGGGGGEMLSPDTIAREHIQFREMMHDAHTR
ncbi:MAG: hypothetical protein WCC70_12650 [Candidatus Aquilonibacter sp.]